MELTYYFNRVANVTREYFIDIYQIKGLVISGPGPTKEEFVNGGYLEYRLQNMIIDTIDASYAGSEGVREAFDKAGNILSNFRLVEEKRIVESLFQKINSHSGLGSYGMDEVIDLLKNNVALTSKLSFCTLGTTIDKLMILICINSLKCNRCSHVQKNVQKNSRAWSSRILWGTTSGRWRTNWKRGGTSI